MYRCIRMNITPFEIPKNLTNKIRNLESELRNMKSGLLALSGGVDSCVLFILAAETNGFNLQAATVVSPAHPLSEIETAIDLVKQYKIPHHLVRLDEIQEPRICENTAERCYFCKLFRYKHLVYLSKQLGLLHVLDGSNADDTTMHRPGIFAIQELQIQTPLIKTGFTKDDIRNIARFKNLPVWNKPSTACFYTRIPTGEPLSRLRIERISKGEKLLAQAGFKYFRLRDHTSVARIELPADQISRILAYPNLTALVNNLKKLGYIYVCVDLEGYRTGSMDKKQGDTPDI
jgi:pyridinium-3,5-biscarboxylic acid mononucleotide sulfurtransferase